MNELVKSNVESIEGEHLTQNEYQLDRLMKIHEEQRARMLDQKLQHERITRQRELEMKLAIMQIQAIHSAKLAATVHNARANKPNSVKPNEPRGRVKEIDKVLMLVFLIICAAILGSMLL